MERDWKALAAEFERYANYGGYEPTAVRVIAEEEGFTVIPNDGECLHCIKELGIFAEAHMLNTYVWYNNCFEDPHLEAYVS